MRTLLEVEEEIDSIIKYNANKHEKEKKRAREQLLHLKSVRLYLEGNPKEEFVRKEEVRLNNRINIIEKDYEFWLSGIPNAFDSATFRDGYDKQTGYLTEKKKHLAHLRTLRYILG